MELAYCGLDCNECPIYIASISPNKAQQIRLAKEYSTDTCEFSQEDMYCLGCHFDTPSEKMCGNCKIRKCGVEKDCKYCAECTDFPCAILEKCLGEKSDSLNNLKQLSANSRKTE